MYYSYPKEPKPDPSASILTVAFYIALAFLLILIFSGVMSNLAETKRAVPTCESYGYQGYSASHMNTKTAILSFECISPSNK